MIITGKMIEEISRQVHSLKLQQKWLRYFLENLAESFGASAKCKVGQMAFTPTFDDHVRWIEELVHKYGLR